MHEFQDNKLAIQLRENLNQERLPILAEADAVARLVESFGKAGDVAKVLGKKPAWVSIRRKIARGSDVLHSFVDGGATRDPETLAMLVDLHALAPDAFAPLVGRSTVGRAMVRTLLDRAKGKPDAAQSRGSDTASTGGAAVSVTHTQTKRARTANARRMCAECGSPMRLQSVGRGVERLWACTNETATGSGRCRYTEAVADDYELSMQEIAGSLVASGSISTAEDWKNEQANARRVVGGLKKLQRQPYMAAGERRALATVVDWLDRYAGAVEQAKRLKSQEEKAAKARRDEREKQALAAFTKRYKSSAAPELVAYFLAMSERFGFMCSACDVSCEDLQALREAVEKRAPAKPYTLVAQRLRRDFERCVRSLATEVSFGEGPVDAQLEAMFRDIDAQVQTVRRVHRVFLDGFTQWLVEQRISESSGTKTPRH